MNKNLSFIIDAKKSSFVKEIINMPTTSQLEVSKLKLDLKNFRTVPQKKEIDAIKAMISIKPDRFFAVMESIIEDGYLPTENIIVLLSPI